MAMAAVQAQPEKLQVAIPELSNTARGQGVLCIIRTPNIPVYRLPAPGTNA